MWSQDIDEVLFSLSCLFDELHAPKHRHDVYQKSPIGMTITFLRSELLSNLCRLSCWSNKCQLTLSISILLAQVFCLNVPRMPQGKSFQLQLFSRINLKKCTSWSRRVSIWNVFLKRILYFKGGLRWFLLYFLQFYSIVHK